MPDHKVFSSVSATESAISATFLIGLALSSLAVPWGFAERSAHLASASSVVSAAGARDGECESLRLLCDPSNGAFAKRRRVESAGRLAESILQYRLRTGTPSTQDAALARARYRGRAGRDPELREDMGEMRLHGCVAHEQFRGYVGVRASRGDELEHLKFSRAHAG